MPEDVLRKLLSRVYGTSDEKADSPNDSIGKHAFLFWLVQYLPISCFSQELVWTLLSSH